MDGYPLCRNLSTKHDVILIAYTRTKKNSPKGVAHHEPRDFLIRRERKVRQPSLVQSHVPTHAQAILALRLFLRPIVIRLDLQQRACEQNTTSVTLPIRELK